MPSLKLWAQMGEFIPSSRIPQFSPFLNRMSDSPDFPNIVSYPFALGALEESRVLVSNIQNNQSASILLPRNLEIGQQGQQLIDVKPLDFIGFQEIDFIKIDVEGMELFVLLGAEKTINQNKPSIFLEVNSLESSFSIIEWARQRDYCPYGLIYPAFNPQNFNLESINIFGDANECGLLLIHKSKMRTCLSIIESLKMPAIKKMDDLVLLLLHKPQYAYEVLEETSVAIKLGINYSAPILKNTEAENFKLGQLVRAAEDALSSKSAELDNLRGEVDHLLATDEMQKTEIDRLGRGIIEAETALSSKSARS